MGFVTGKILLLNGIPVGGTVTPIRRVKVETSEGSFQLDSVGTWTQDKLRILRDYSERYSQVMAKQKGFKHAYIDAFSGPGEHIDRNTGGTIQGSPMNALDVVPPFDCYYLVNQNGAKADYLKSKIGVRDDVKILSGDCNVELLDNVFPHVRYEDYWRALCFVDPYGVHIDWDVIRKAGSMRSLELFINFSIYDINLNVVRNDPKDIEKAQVARMDRFWGDHSWHGLLYT